VFILLLFFAAGLGQSTLPSQMSDWSRSLHERCLQQAPDSRHTKLARALVCGENLQPSETTLWFQKTGLLHLMVVSGSHLIWLEWLLRLLLRRVPGAGFFILMILLLFAGVALLAPPVTRSAISLMLSQLSNRHSLRLTSTQLVFFSGLISLLLFPHWISSFSLLLSWTAALALSLQKKSDSLLRFQVRIYLVMALCLLPIALPHPVSVLTNLILSPLLGAILFPVCLMGFAFEPLAPLSDLMFDLLLVILKEISIGMPDENMRLQIAKPLIWVYLTSLNLGFAFVEVVRRRQVHLQPQDE